LDEAAFLDCLRESACDRSLSPEYDSQLARWTFARARCASSGGTIHSFVVRTADGRVAGWCVYCLGRDNVAEVLQIGAARGAMNDVVDHVLRDAMENGAVAVSGRLEPALAPALAAKRAIFYRGPFWTLIHSPRLEVRDAVHRGDAFLTRLEGEWCLR